MPDDWKNRPQLENTFAEFLEAFHFLSNSRPLHVQAMGGGSVGFISPMEITNLQKELYPHLDKFDFMVLIQHMDSIYVQKQNEKLTPASGKK